jgi:FAD/FMN-containing dehydrogenase/Fe-S oxidoreductase
MRTHARIIQIQTKTPPAHLHDRFETGTSRRILIDASALEADLRRALRGEVRFSGGDRGLYASDAGNYRMVPIGVVLPHDADDVLRTLEACRRHGAPIVARGGGTGIPGQTVNAAVVIDFSKYMNRIAALDPRARRARVEPGLVLDELRDAAAVHGLTFGPDPATHSRCTLGGMIGNNSCGIHSVMAGETVDNIEGLEVVTYDGTRMHVGKTSDEEYARIVAAGGRRADIYRRLRTLRDDHGDAIRRGFPAIPRRVSGYNLPALLPEHGFDVARALVGSECTCVIVLEATTTLVRNPPVRSLLVAGFPDIFIAADHVVDPMPFRPVGVEALDHSFLEAMRKKGMHPAHLDLLPEGKAWLLVEFGGETKAAADAAARGYMHARGDGAAMTLLDDPDYERLLWDLREAGLGATAKIPGEPDNHEGWEDASVPPDRLGAYLREFKALMDRYGYEGPLYGHFGQGCVHTRLTFDLLTSEGIATWRRFLGEAADLVVHHGGSLSGEHGDGQARGELLPRMFEPEILDAFHEFKSIWDPDWKMNPGKVIDAFRVDENLRLGAGYAPATPPTHFAFSADGHSFAAATERCVGAGVCRRHDGGTMCPSYMVTREEMHSTRGRARLLNEMLRGEAVTDGWKSEAVKGALDLCLSCKGCKGECPVQVDMATYKAEFLSHYYERRVRPRSAYTMGHIHRWARLASLAPGLANFATHAPLAATAARMMAGVHPDRRIPSFAAHTFIDWFRTRPHAARRSGRPVVLWPDTFTNHFRPHAARAAVDVLEAAGFDVRVPMQDVCCGRPLYDWGMLDQARTTLEHTLAVLREPVARGIPVVVLEPSCASVFRDELPEILGGNLEARRLSGQTLLLSELLRRDAPDFTPPPLERKALVHGHCHHKAIMKMNDEVALLEAMKIDVDMPDTGCCGMAGAFGFERAHYDVSMACGERVLLPAVRAASPDTLIVADGFSCQEQIAQSVNRRPLHLAEVIEMALHQDHARVPLGLPEQMYSPEPASPWKAAATLAALGAAAWFLRNTYVSARVSSELGRPSP